MNFFIELKEGLAISWDAIRANKLRSALTTLGIVIGIVTVTLMGTAIEGLNQAFMGSIAAIGTDTLFIQKYPWFSDDPWWTRRNRRDITLADGKRVAEQVTTASAVCLESFARKSIRYNDRTASGVTIIGNSEEGAFVGGLVLTGPKLS